MKKRVLAMVSILVFTLGMSMTVMAAPSPVAVNDKTSSSWKPSKETIATTDSGEAITEASLYADLNATSLSTSVEGASLTNVGPQAAACLVNKANEVVGANANIVTMVDIQVPEGTGTASFTLSVPSLVAGQSVTVLHLKSATDIEVLPVTAVNNGSVTFTMSSYSPVAVVVNATAPKTADMNMAWIAVLALVSAGGAVVMSKKYFA